MTLLVFGKTGQVARELARHPETVCLDRHAADLADPATCAKAIRDRRPWAVINAAAYTAVDRAEEEEDLATITNGDAPGAMAEACADLGIPFVHISTDYVFSGDGSHAWTPDDSPGPIGAYGRSKLVGERAVRAAGGPHAVLRTSWVFSSHGRNFVKTILRLAEDRDHLRIVSDQVGGPTPARAIAAACMEIADQLRGEPGKAGIYHFSGKPDTTWADFARAILAAGNRTCIVEDIPSSAYPTPATRPLNSRLDCSATTKVFGIDRPDWRAHLGVAVDEILRGDETE